MLSPPLAKEGPELIGEVGQMFLGAPQQWPIRMASRDAQYNRNNL
jgi:hypothetical protein